ncbi:MAG: cupin domain-containing protein [Thermodesulfobacteriota bacterium]
MDDFFPDPVSRLPLADIPLEGVTAHLSQGEGHQILFMRFAKDVDLPEHAHAAQAGFVLEGRIELTIAGKRRVFGKGDRYFIPAGTPHSGKIFAGYADITFFDEPARYTAKK